MSKLMLLVQILGIGSALGGSVDYAQDYNRYTVHPYYQQQHSENPNTVESFHHQQEAPPQNAPPLDERFGGFFPPGGNFAVGFGGPPPPPGTSEGGYSNNGPPGPINPPPFGHPDPGFQTQTGFEGLLIPNTWYGLLPWGIEGVIIVIAGIIVFAIIIIAIIGLIAWLVGVKTALPWVKTEDAEGARSSFRDRWGEPFMNLSANVIDAIEKFNDSEEEGLKKAV